MRRTDGNGDTVGLVTCRSEQTFVWPSRQPLWTPDNRKGPAVLTHDEAEPPSTAKPERQQP